MLEFLTIDPDIQPRDSLDRERVEDFTELIGAGAEFPALVAYWDGTTLWLSDGFHRYAAACGAELITFQVEVRLGSRRDAIRYAIKANSNQGKPLTRRERNRAMETLIVEFYPDDMSQQEIADEVGVSQPTVNRACIRIIQMNNSNGATSIDDEPERRGPGRPRKNRDDDTAPQTLMDAASDQDDDADDSEEPDEPIGFEMPEREEESPEEKAYYTISCITLYAERLEPDAVAAACQHAEGSAYRFRALTTWLEEVTRILERQVQNPVRSVK